MAELLIPLFELFTLYIGLWVGLTMGFGFEYVIEQLRIRLVIVIN